MPVSLFLKYAQGYNFLCFLGELPTPHSNYSLHKGCLQTLLLSPFLLTLCNCPVKGWARSSLCVQNSHHFGSHLEIDDPGGEVSLFCSFLSLAWSQCNLFGAFLLLFYTSNRENGDLFPYNLIIAWIACPSLVRWRGIRGAEYKLLGMPTTSFNLFGYYSSQWNEDIIFAQFISVPFRQDRYAKPSDTP